MPKRVFLIVLDSFGIGGAPDAAEFGDAGSDTLAAVAASPAFCAPVLTQLGLLNIDGVVARPKTETPSAAFGRLVETSQGKDTTVGHWELAGLESPRPMPVFPDGFPVGLIAEFERRCGRKTLCNLPYSGTDVIRDYGAEHMKTGALIVYTSADSVFQVAAHEEIVPPEELYRVCRIARELLAGEWAVGRVIARPFVGNLADGFVRTANRHDFSLAPPEPTVLDALQKAGHSVIGVGKIHDIFAGRGITERIAAKSNDDGMGATLALARRNFGGLAFINLVEFDSVYGHRNDTDGYAAAISRFDGQLAILLPLLGPEDMLMITADHGCDPSTPSTDHSRECVPLLIYGAGIQAGVNLGTRRSFGCVANTIAEIFGLPARYTGQSLLEEIQIM